MQSYSHLLYKVEDSVVISKAIQTDSARQPKGQCVTGPLGTWDRDRWWTGTVVGLERSY